jgi:hypothetical protein
MRRSRRRISAADTSLQVGGRVSTQYESDIIRHMVPARRCVPNNISFFGIETVAVPFSTMATPPGQPIPIEPAVDVDDSFAIRRGRDRIVCLAKPYIAVPIPRRPQVSSHRAARFVLMDGH